jgi:hypothetical protein
MTEIIGGVIPQGKSHQSGIVNLQRENQWAQQKAECLERYRNKKAQARAETNDLLDQLEFKACKPTPQDFNHLLSDWNDARIVSEVIIGAQDVQVKATVRGGRPQLGGGVRGSITEWSKKSRARCERHIRNVPDGSILAFLTLTYPSEFTNDGKEVKRDLAVMVKRLKRMGVVGGIWFLEFQKRGAPHVHCFINTWPTGGASAVAKAWYEVVGSGDEKHLHWHEGRLSGRPCLELMRVPHAASFYACKYAVKSEQKDVPEAYLNVGRFWGSWGGLKPVYEYYYARGSAMARAAVDMVRIWKAVKFGGHVGQGLSLYSATLRGCSVDDLISLYGSSGWCPDG